MPDFGQPPAASPPPAPASAPAAESFPRDRIVSIRGASCGDLLRLSAEDREEAAMFYIGYQSARFRAGTINVSAIPDMEVEALGYCAEHPDRTAAEAFAKAYAYVTLTAGVGSLVGHLAVKMCDPHGRSPPNV